MSHYTATEARKNFFTLIDAAVKGEPVLIERHGVLLEIAPSKRFKAKAKKSQSIDYSPYIKGSLEDADQWTWDWHPSQGLSLKERPSRKR